MKPDWLGSLEQMNELCSCKNRLALAVLHNSKCNCDEHIQGSGSTVYAEFGV